MTSYYIIAEADTADNLTLANPALCGEAPIGISHEMKTAFADIVRNRPGLVFADYNLVKDYLKELDLLRQISVIIFITGNYLSLPTLNAHNNEIPYAETHSSCLAKDARAGKSSLPIEGYEKEKEFLLIKTTAKDPFGINEFSIEAAKIVYVEAMRNYQLIHFSAKDKQLQTYGTLKSIQDRLPSYFLRVHKSFLINAYEIVRIKGSEYLIMNNSQEIKINIGPRYKASFSKWKKQNSLLINNYITA